MRGLAGRSSEINKPKGERRWGWGEEVEARVGGRRRLKGTSGPTAPSRAGGQGVVGEGWASGECGKLSHFPEGGDGSGTK